MLVCKKSEQLETSFISYKLQTPVDVQRIKMKVNILSVVDRNIKFNELLSVRAKKTCTLNNPDESLLCININLLLSSVDSKNEK